MKSLWLALVSLAALTGLPEPARAHPHVWVTAKAEVVYASDGTVSGVRHRWTFDAGYSAYLTQGLDKNGDGKLTPDELQEVAKENAESLVDFEYFTVLKVNGAKQAFEAPREYGMTFENGQAELWLFLPAASPAKGKTVGLEIYDPTFFVSFNLADGEDAVRLAGAPQGCTATVSRPKPAAADQQKLSEAFFGALTAASNYGSNFANRAIIACP
jgi:ABC-type uncharacterized transport system substrate-binding protein